MITGRFLFGVFNKEKGGTDDIKHDSSCVYLAYSCNYLQYVYTESDTTHYYVRRKSSLVNNFSIYLT